MLEEDLTQLCKTNKAFLGVFGMICIILGVLLHIANYFINSRKPKTSKKPLLWLAGTAILIIAIISIAIYILTPPLLAALGVKPVQGCEVDSSPDYYTPPYCGEYCNNRSIAPAYENCTCMNLKYALK
ncbi:MAG: hypothetical protein V1861_02950 [Candidatus Micrarchaeota archaeon]